MNPRLKRYTTGTGKGYPLNEEIKKEIYHMYFNGPYGMRAIAHKLGICKSTVRRHVKRMQEEQAQV
tara:strand:+ start:1195 stop:1392 length:198 start_codon:yes stop_codon:yes gene_type:complete